MEFGELCTQGESADSLLAAGRFAEAEAAYAALLDEVTASKTLDAFVLSKITLGMLVSLIHQDRENEAAPIWTSEIKDGPLGIGIYGLENGQTSVHDLIVYFMVSAHLQSLNPDPAHAVEAVSDFMGRVRNYATAEDPSLLPLLANNWRVHLQEIYEGAPIPDHASAELRALQQTVGLDAQRAIKFPAPSPWIVDWNGPDDEVTAFTPDGSVERIPREQVAELGKQKKRGFFSRLFGA